jgi:hypothetical protein
VALGSGYQSYFASMTASAQAALIAEMQASNIEWVRIDADWSQVEPDEGTYCFTATDTVVSALTSNGMNVVILLYESPQWARQPAGTAPLDSPWPTPDPAQYAAYCQKVVERYSAAPYGVHTYELWNEPNLDTGVAAGKSGTSSGWGYLSPMGFAGLATAAYPLIKEADPDSLVLGGTLATHDEYGYGGTVRSGASWPAIASGATTAQVSCATAAAGDQYMLIADASALLPVGTYIAQVQTGVGYTIAAPAWCTNGFPSAISPASSTTVNVSFGYAPDVFLAQAYVAAEGQPMWDALAIHPYTQPFLPQQQPLHAGGFTMIPTLRQIMVANGETNKPMWITEIGGSTGRAAADWPATAATATTLAVTTPNATTDDVHYFVVDNGLPTGSYVADATAGGGWTVMPPTCLTLATALAAGTATGTISVLNNSASQQLSIPSGTLIKVLMPSVDAGASGTTDVVKTTTTESATIAPGATALLTVEAVTPTDDYDTTAVIQASIGQTFGTAIAAVSDEIVYVYPPGVLQNGEVSEATQASIITQTFAAIETGLPADGTYPAIGPLPYIDAVFVYCWSDQGGTAGPFGLVRADGTSKPALAALRTATTPAPTA